MPKCCSCCNLERIRRQEVGGYYEKEKDKDNKIKKVWVDDPFSCDGLRKLSVYKRLGWCIFFPTMIVSFIFGARLFWYERVLTVPGRYDDAECKNGYPCTIAIVLDRDMPAPIYFNYQLKNFYQSHRVYLNSKSMDQLGGDVLDTKNCNPSSKFNGSVIYPCGLLPQSIFTDRFSIDVERNVERNNTIYNTIYSLCPTCPTHEDDIDWDNYWDSFDYNGTWELTGTWGGMADRKFKTATNFPKNDTYTRSSSFLSDTELELPYPGHSDMIVWLRTAVKHTFKKPHRVIKDFPLLAGDKLHVRIFQFFDAGENTEKYFYLETAPGFGPRTKLLGSLCIGIGLVSGFMFAFVLSPFGHRPLTSQ